MEPCGRRGKSRVLKIESSPKTGGKPFEGCTLKPEMKGTQVIMRANHSEEEKLNKFKELKAAEPDWLWLQKVPPVPPHILLLQEMQLFQAMSDIIGYIIGNTGF